MFHPSSFQLATLRKVSLEPRRINFQTTNASRPAKLNNGPIVSRPATAFSFPAVTHVGRSARHDQIVAVTKKHIATREHASAVLHPPPLDLSADELEPLPIRRH